MEDLTMVQKRLWKEKKFRLDDGILHFKEVGLFSGFEAELRYEDIIGEKRTKRKPNYFLLVAGGFLMWLSVVNIFSYSTGEVSGIIVPVLGGMMASALLYIVYRSHKKWFILIRYIVNLLVFLEIVCIKKKRMNLLLNY